MGVDTGIVVGYGIEVSGEIRDEVFDILEKNYEYIDDDDNDLFFTVYSDGYYPESDIVILLVSSVYEESYKTGLNLGITFKYPEIQKISQDDDKKMNNLYELLVSKLKYDSLIEKPKKLIYIRGC
jgi:hypothetical protein